MATTINPLQTSTNVRPVDIGQAGSLAAKSISDLAKSLTAIPQANVNRAEEDFLNKLRTAEKTQDFSGVNTDELIRAGADATKQAQIEDQLKGSQLNVLKDQTIGDFQSTFEKNPEALNKVISQYAQTNPELAKIASVNNAGTLAFDNLNYSPEQVATAKDALANIIQTQDTGFKKIPNQRELTQQLTKQVKALGGTREDAKAIAGNVAEYRKELSSLNEEEQTLVSTLNEKTLQNFNEQTLKAETLKQVKENETGWKTEDAAKLLNTKENDIWDWVKNEAPVDYDWQIWKDMGGEELKRELRPYLNKRELDDGTQIRPWMVLNALRATAQTDPEAKTIDKEDFEEQLKIEAKNTDKINRIRQASLFDQEYKQQKLQLEAAKTAALSNNVKTVKNQVGIRNIPFNASIADRVIGEELRQLQQQGAAPDNSVQAPNIGGGGTRPDNGMGFLEHLRNVPGFVGSLIQGDPLSLSSGNPVGSAETNTSVDSLDAARQIQGGSFLDTINAQTTQAAENEKRLRQQAQPQTTGRTDTLSVPVTQIRGNAGLEPTVNNVAKEIEKVEKETDRPVPLQHLELVEMYQKTNGSDRLALERLLNHPSIKGDSEAIKRIRKAWAAVSNR